jgi:hypothetical protein
VRFHDARSVAGGSLDQDVCGGLSGRLCARRLTKGKAQQLFDMEIQDPASLVT